MTEEMIEMRDLLEALDFEIVSTKHSKRPPAYAIDLGNISLFVEEGTNALGANVLLMKGVAWSRNRRTMREIEYGLPFKAASIQQGVALIVYGVGYEIEPEVPALWFELGRQCKDQLPWAIDPTLVVEP